MPHLPTAADVADAARAIAGDVPYRIGPIGIGLVTALLGSLAWLLSDLDLIDIGQTAVLDLVLLTMLATLLSIGLSWSHLRNRLSGQIDSDDVTTPPPI